jgi:Terminase large subunit, T4likevirus-type, N-terminal/Terminase RNaseH-like domain
VSLTETQRAFATSREPFPCFCGGFGSGKTAAAIARAMALKSHFRDCSVAYYLPTFPLVEDIAFDRFPALCERKGWEYRLRKGNSPFIEFPGAGKIVFRTMENPERIVGYEVAHSIIDELDTLPIEKARQVWNKVIARNRQKCSMPNTVAVATTPEGFRFVHERWVKNSAPGYVLFRAKTMDNAEHLPAEYIPNLRNTYSSQLLAAYLDGEFVNLTSGSVYPEFSRVLNSSDETIKQNETLHVGMDFNVSHGAAAIHVLRGDDPHAVAELVDVFDTPAMIKMLTERYKAKGHALMIYPDASGKNRKSQDASASDIALLRQAGFQICANPANPAVKDRVLSANAMIHREGSRRYRVNPETCPHLVEALEKQAYDKHGEPDKTSGFDHIIDAATYFVVYRYPIVKRIATVEQLRM